MSVLLKFGIKTNIMGDYHDLYLESDVLLLPCLQRI